MIVVVFPSSGSFGQTVVVVLLTTPGVVVFVAVAAALGRFLGSFVGCGCSSGLLGTHVVLVVRIPRLEVVRLRVVVAAVGLVGGTTGGGGCGEEEVEGAVSWWWAALDVPPLLL